MVGLMSWGSVASEQGWRKGPWTPEEDKLLFDYVTMHGEGRWSSVARGAGLNRSGKSCRLRWVNYLRPGLKRGQITPQEEGIIIELHSLWGNKWSTIARYLPGRTDNEIKNYWRTHFKKKERSTRKASQRRKSSQALKKHAKSSPPTLSSQPPQLLETQPLETPKIEPPVISSEQMITAASSSSYHPAMEEHNLMMITPSLPWMDATCQDHDGSTWWGSLWNFPDQTQSEKLLTSDQMQQQEQYCSKVATLTDDNYYNNSNNSNNSNISTNYNAFSWGGDVNNLYNIEGCIF